MGAGLSMASVNKIKELANSREYSLALELVEHQDLTKSLNPQFLRLCGEIYIKNDKYEDARRCLIMAHRLGPESKRILYTFVELYLRMGYFQLAKTYYDMYMFDANAYDSRDMEYIWNKHEHADDYKLLEPLIAGYAHNLDYDWSFELYLLYKKEEKQNEAGALAELYHASFKNSENSQIILDIEAGKAKVDTYFNIYADTEAADDSPDMEALRTEEQELLAADDLRMHPKEAEITIMYEDSYTPAGSEKKVQKMLKKQEREEQRKEKKLLKKQKQQEKAEAAAAAEAEETEKKADTEAEEKPDTELNPEPEAKAPETAADGTERKGFFRRWKKKKHEGETGEAVPDEVVEEKETPIPEKPEAVEEKAESETADNATSEPEDVKTSKEPKESNSENSSEIAETTGQAENMSHRKGTIAKDVVVVDEDDGFEAEADTIEELAEKEHGTQVAETKEAEVTGRKPAFEFQTLELAPEDFEEEYEVDDFSEKLDAEFGEMKMPEPKPEIEETVEETVEEEPEVEETVEETVEEEPEVEETVEETVEEEPEVEETVEEAVEEEPEVEETVKETVEEEPEIEETVEETVEEEPEVEETVEETVEEEPEVEETVEETVEEEPEVEETVEETVEEEPEVEETVEEAVEEEPEAEEETVESEMETEPEPEVEETVEETVEEEPEIEETVEETVEEEPEEEFHVAPFTTKPDKKKLDFPVFKSSLFPDYHKEVKVVENNFNEIMEEAQDKMTENMQKEEQMQREAEALLASLGISMDSIPATPKAEKKEEQPVQEGPSRDELKASLKIDSVKKNLLKRVKEYR